MKGNGNRRMPAEFVPLGTAEVERLLALRCGFGRAGHGIGRCTSRGSPSWTGMSSSSVVSSLSSIAVRLRSPPSCSCSASLLVSSTPTRAFPLACVPSLLVALGIIERFDKSMPTAGDCSARLARQRSRSAGGRLFDGGAETNQPSPAAGVPRDSSVGARPGEPPPGGWRDAKELAGSGA
jgi:hypothetical protein